MTTSSTSRITAFPSMRADASDALPAIADKITYWKNWENERESFPGEHWIVLGAGVAALVAAARSDHTATRLLGVGLGLALMARAASGRDGIAKALPYLKQVPDLPAKRWF